MLSKDVLHKEAEVGRCSAETVFLEISQNSQEDTCARVSFFNKVADIRPATLLKKRLWHRCFPVNFAKFLKHFFYRTLPVGAYMHSSIMYTVLSFSIFTVHIKNLNIQKQCSLKKSVLKNFVIFTGKDLC